MKRHLALSVDSGRRAHASSSPEQKHIGRKARRVKGRTERETEPQTQTWRGSQSSDVSSSSVRKHERADRGEASVVHVMNERDGAASR